MGCIIQLFQFGRQEDNKPLTFWASIPVLICHFFPVHICILNDLGGDMNNELLKDLELQKEKTALLSIESWLFNRKAYNNGLLSSPHNWVGYHPLYTLIQQAGALLSLTSEAMDIFGQAFVDGKIRPLRLIEAIFQEDTLPKFNPFAPETLTSQ